MALQKADYSELATIESNPKDELLFQTKVANALMDVVAQNTGKFVTKIGNKDFLGFEAWQTIARLNQCSVIVESTEPIYDAENEIIAYDTWAKVIRAGGELVARANMECGMDSFPTRGKEGRERHKAAKSASQTWAGAKACRMAFSFVAVLAGYEATPAEEMMALGVAEPEAQRMQSNTDQNTHPWLLNCPVHKLAWFQTKNMREPAHKQGNGMCNQSQTLNPLLSKQLEEITAEWNNKTVNDWLKLHHGGTFSTFSAQQKINILVQLKTTPVNGVAIEPTASDGSPVDTETGLIMDTTAPAVEAPAEAPVHPETQEDGAEGYPPDANTPPTEQGSEPDWENDPARKV